MTAKQRLGPFFSLIQAYKLVTWASSGPEQIISVLKPYSFSKPAIYSMHPELCGVIEGDDINVLANSRQLILSLFIGFLIFD